MEERVGDHRLGRLDAAEHQHGRIRHSLAHRKPADVDEIRFDGCAQRCERLGTVGAGRPARLDLGHGGDDPVVPAQHLASVGGSETERVENGCDGERAGELAPQLCPPGRLERVDETVGLGCDDRLELSPHLVETEAPRERISMPVVLGPVGREHAPSHDLTRREARIVDGERLGVAHHLEREVSPGDHPSVERREPRHRLALAQAREQRVRVGLELLERRRRAERERRFAGDHPRDPSRENDAVVDVDVVVVGGGLAGLAAAWHLRDLDVLVLEAEDRVGGRIRSEARDGLWLNLGAHVFAGPGTASGRLIDETRVTAMPVPGHLAAVALGGRVVAGGRVGTYPMRLPMSLRSRASLIRAGIRLRLAVRRYAAIAAELPGEDAADTQRRILEQLDDRSFSDFIGPLPADVDAIIRATLNRSSGEPEELAAGYGIGYFHLVWSRGEGLSRNILGGPSRLIEALAHGPIVTAARVTQVREDGGGVVVGHARGEVRARSAVVATPAFVTREIVQDLPAETAAALGAVRYGPYVVGAFLVDEAEPMPWQGLYALATPGRSFSMLFNTANVLGRGGSLMVYAAAGGARALEGIDDADVRDRFLADLDEVFPHTRRFVREVVIQRWPSGLPYAAVGRARLQGPLTRPLGRIHLAGDYLGTKYTETAAQTGEAAASAARRLLRSG